MPSPLDVLFQPRSVAVIGASRDPQSLGGTLFRNLAATFRGPIYPINPNAQNIGGLPAFASILDVPGPVDLAFIVVPAGLVLPVARQSIERGVKGLVVISAGFSEIGAEGKAREEELLALARAAGIPLLGPNCFGLLSNDPQAPLNGTFSVPATAAGNVAIGTQSGALGFVLADGLRRRGLGLWQLVSLGNKCDVVENALLARWAGDPAVQVIQLYLESLEAPRQFLRLARDAGRFKPVVLLKAGRTGAGNRAAGSHTAALASSDAAVDGLVEQSGVVRADCFQELFDITSLLATQPLPKGDRVALVTNSGGPAVLCADALESHGLVLPEFSATLQNRLRAFLPAEATVRNPVDLIASIDPEGVRRVLQELLASREVDAVIVLYVPRLPLTTGPIAQAASRCAAAAGRDTAVLLVLMDWEAQAEVERLGKIGLPCFRAPEGAAAALAKAVRYARWRERGEGLVPPVPGATHGRAARWSARGGWLSPDDVYTLLADFGIPVARWRIARSSDEAAKAAEELGFPLVVKVISPTTIHKSDVEGVVLDVRSAEAVRAAFQQATRAAADAEGVLVQQFLPGGREMAIGVTHDPAFGHLIGFGLGGVWVEALGDVRFRLHPLSDRDAEELIGESAAARVLTSDRGGGPADVAALLGALLQVSALVSAVPEIRQADLNPVSVRRQGEGICVLDARINVAPRRAAK
ncbi:MAG: acetate--CoA ligase family protein [Planctomycetia bacterium]|nr:acetate--CoA ligase family protein [Planctomycetia bacterium]